MSKKIVAVSLALVLIVTCFVACGKKYETTNINGKDVILVTDENGDPIVNDDNELIAVVTDRAGEVVTFENGEEQTYHIGLKSTIEIEGVAYGEHYRFDILSGWEATSGPRINKKDTDGKCYIEFTKTHTLKEDESFYEAFKKTDETNEEILKGFEDEAKMKEIIKSDPSLAKYEGSKYTIESNDTVFTAKSYPCRIYVHKVVDSKGAMLHYGRMYYFLVGDTIYCVRYSCINGIGYDETFDFGNYLIKNFEFVD